jgi:hypothetical protein
MFMTIAELTFTDVETDEDISPAAALIFPLLGLCLSVLLFSGPQAADIAAVSQFLE